MVRQHDRSELLSHAVRAALEGGLRRVTFRSVADRAGVPDRTVVYYFPTKQHLLTAVIDATATQLMTSLQDAVGDTARSANALAAAAWPVLTDPSVRPVVQVWLDVVVGAGAGDQPHRDAGQALARRWLEWLAERADAASPEERQRIASTVLVRLDGALLLHHLGLEVEARRALADM